MEMILAILGYLGMAQSALPIIEDLLTGLGTLVAKAYSTVFGADAAAKLADGIAEAEGLVKSLDLNLPMAMDFVKNMYADLDQLLGRHPELAKQLFAAHTLSESQGISHGDATRLLVAVHAKVRAA